MTKQLHNIIDINHYRSILCLNGDLPDRDFFNCNLPIIAADGAANQLISLGLDPHAIVGDLDSIDHTLKKRYQTVYDADQNRNDYQKSLEYLQTNHLLPTIVTGIHGGHLDHVLNNINIFLQTESVLYAPPVIGMTIRGNEKKSFELAINTKLSIIGFPECTISSSGLKWELRHHQLSFPGSNACFNRASFPSVTLTVENGLALILIYLQEISDHGLASS